MCVHANGAEEPSLGRASEDASRFQGTKFGEHVALIEAGVASDVLQAGGPA